MDEPSLSGIAITSGLILLHAFISMIYAAYNNVKYSWLKEQVEDGNARATKVLELTTTNASKLVVVMQILRLIVLFSIVTVLNVNVVAPLLADSPSMSEPLAFVLVLGVAGLFILIIGEIVAESLGSAYANPIALWTANTIGRLVMLFNPLVITVVAISRFLSTVFGGRDLVNTVTEEEIMTLVDAGHSGGTIEEEEKEMIFSVLQLDQTRASEVMIPRIDIVSVDLETSLADVGQLFIESGYSRIPVYEENIDQIRGVLYAKDLLAHLYNKNVNAPMESIHDLMRPVSFVPETQPADELLKELQARKVHLAVVQDEYGGTSGLVTIENIIEEIIGDIQDEYDLNEEADYEIIGTDEYLMDGSIDLDDVNNMLDVDLPAEDNDTLGGYIYTYFERIPEENEVIETDGLIIRVQSVDGHRIRKVQVIRKRPQTDDETNKPEGTGDAETAQPPSLTIVEKPNNE